MHVGAFLCLVYLTEGTFPHTAQALLWTVTQPIRDILVRLLLLLRLYITVVSLIQHLSDFLRYHLLLIFLHQVDVRRVFKISLLEANFVEGRQNGLEGFFLEFFTRQISCAQFVGVVVLNELFALALPRGLLVGVSQFLLDLSGDFHSPILAAIVRGARTTLLLPLERVRLAVDKAVESTAGDREVKRVL